MPQQLKRKIEHRVVHAAVFPIKYEKAIADIQKIGGDQIVVTRPQNRWTARQQNPCCL